MNAPALLAHVKWFSDFDWSTPPKSFEEIATATFWSMMILSVVTLILLAAVDQWVQNSAAMQRVSHWFDSKAESSLLVMRVGTFATLLVAWQQGTLFAPELAIDNAWIERFQFVVILLLFSERTTPAAGLGLLAIWLWGVRSFGLFHMLDYVSTAGVAYFLTVRPLPASRVRDTALPALYATLGFSLMWLGCEKLVYPEWVGYLLQQNPVLTLGLDQDFFRVAAAFIELGLGFMLIIGLFGRSLSIVVTLTFFCTTMVFGKVEIIGHTLIHAALIVFLFEGPGRVFRPPAYFHRALPMRMAFASVNFAIAVAVVLFAYSSAAQKRAEAAQSAPTPDQHPLYELAASGEVPSIAVAATPDSKGGWNLHFTVAHFEFAPQHAGQANVDGQGHIHLHVDGKKAARIYSPWFYLPPLPPGEHELRASLTTNDHREYAVDGKAIEARAMIPAP